MSCSIADNPSVVHNTNNAIGMRSVPIGVFSETLCSSVISARKCTAMSKPGLATAKATLVIFSLDVGC